MRPAAGAKRMVEHKEKSTLHQSARDSDTAEHRIQGSASSGDRSAPLRPDRKANQDILERDE